MDELLKELEQKLRTNPWLQNVKLGLRGVNGNQNYVVITGRATSYYQKQQASHQASQLIKERCPMVSLHNEIEVVYSNGKRS